HVVGAKRLLVPRELADLNFSISIVEAAVEEDGGAIRIRCADILCPADKPSGVLIEVRSRSYVCGNHLIAAPHTVDLNSHQHRHRDLIQLSCELHHCRAAEALPIKNNA